MTNKQYLRLAAIKSLLAKGEYKKAAEFLRRAVESAAYHATFVQQQRDELHGQLARSRELTIEEKLSYLRLQAKAFGITLTDPLVTAVLQKLEASPSIGLDH